MLSKLMKMVEGEMYDINSMGKSSSTGNKGRYDKAKLIQSVKKME